MGKRSKPIHESHETEAGFVGAVLCDFVDRLYLIEENPKLTPDAERPSSRTCYSLL